MCIRDSIIAILWAVSSVGSTLLHAQEGMGSLEIVKLIALFDNPNPAWLPSRWTADLIAQVFGNKLENPMIQLGSTILSRSWFPSAWLHNL